MDRALEKKRNAEAWKAFTAHNGHMPESQTEANMHMEMCLWCQAYTAEVASRKPSKVPVPETRPGF